MPRPLPPWVPYVVPFGLYLALTGLESSYPAYYAALYTIKIVVVTVAAIWLRLPHHAAYHSGLGGRTAAQGVAAGVVLTFLWVLIDKITPHPQWLGAIVGKRVGFNPYQAFSASAPRIAFLCVRFFGLVALVPYLEEMFYRNFLPRFIVDPDDFSRTPVGRWTRPAITASALVFALSHPEWLSALVFALAMTWLVWKTRDIRACILAHGITNLCLGVYVLYTHQWGYW